MVSLKAFYNLIPMEFPSEIDEGKTLTTDLLVLLEYDEAAPDFALPVKLILSQYQYKR